MIIKCLNPETLMCFDVIPKAKSIIWNKKFLDIGSFEIHVDRANVEKNDIIQIGNNAGIIMEKIETFDEVQLFGYDLRGLTAFRYLFGEQSKSGSVESIIKQLANDCFKIGDRTISNFNIKKNLNRGEYITWHAENAFLSECLNNIALDYAIGYDISIDEESHEYLFDIVIPKDRTSTVFSRKFHNLDEIEYDVSIFDTYNVVYYANSSGEIQCLGGKLGVFRRESGTDKPDEASQFLKDNAEIETIRGTASDKMQYGIDWDVGDFVKVEFKGLETIKQITEATIVFEKSNNKVIPIFGEDRQNPIKRLFKR